MHRKLFTQFIFFIILILGGMFLPHLIFAACNTGVDIYIDGNTVPDCSGNAIFSEGNWIPGSKKEHAVEFKNVEADKDFDVYFEIENAKGNFAKRINLLIECNGTAYTYGKDTTKTLTDFYTDYPKDNGKIIFTLNKGESKTCTFQTAFNPLTDAEDNEYNCTPEKNMTAEEIEKQCATSFDLKFGFAVPTVTPSGGNGPEWSRQNTNPGGGTVQAVATSPIKKVFQAIKLPKKLPRVGAWSALVAASLGLIATVVVYRKNKK